MRFARNTALLGTMLGIAGTASAVEILVCGDIAVSTLWTANNTYNLQCQVYVLPGATLTIEAGTVVASTPQANGGGSLAVARGAQIFVNGTAANPVIMTSTADVATWTGGDPETGTWREAANEWGNLTLMGDGLISASHFGGAVVFVNGVPNTNTPTGLNQKQMEGLIAGFPGDTKVLYGGADDNDDSGSISYLSLRYTGRVVGIGNELNGLSLGGIGRETDIHHVDIMNNVDDGIEVWGGTVNLKHFNIWNIGDDSFDVDQGWRGKAQFGLIVQGYSINAAQGSGVGDNCIETDGAEDSDAQPVTTSTIYNLTVVGMPIDGDGGTVWRDNARVQYRNSIFTNIGDQLVRPDNLDGDGAQGYGFNGTLSWPNTWTTSYAESLNLATTVNGCDDIPGGCSPGDFNYPDQLYTAQVDGNLAEITDSVFYGNAHASAYTEAAARGVLNPANNNLQEPASSPLVSLTRAPGMIRGGLFMQQVVDLDPRAANDALNSVGAAPADGFFTSAPYRGGFSGGENWLKDWTAADAFGFVDVVSCPWDCQATPNGNVGINDLLDLLAQWGNGGPCDFDGAGVGITDLLALLAQWGSCP